MFSPCPLATELPVALYLIGLKFWDSNFVQKRQKVWLLCHLGRSCTTLGAMTENYLQGPLFVARLQGHFNATASHVPSLERAQKIVNWEFWQYFWRPKVITCQNVFLLQVFTISWRNSVWIPNQYINVNLTTRIKHVGSIVEVNI